MEQIMSIPPWTYCNSFLVVTTFSTARHGSQPPLLLLLYDRVEWIPEVWNVDGVSGSNVAIREEINGNLCERELRGLNPWKEHL